MPDWQLPFAHFLLIWQVVSLNGVPVRSLSQLAEQVEHGIASQQHSIADPRPRQTPLSQRGRATMRPYAMPRVAWREVPLCTTLCHAMPCDAMQVEAVTSGNFVFSLDSGEMIVMSAQKVLPY